MKILLVLLALTGVAAAEPVRVVVRDAGRGDDVVLRRLEGHVVDLDVEVETVDGALEATLDAQIAVAPRLADAKGATAVVWFRPDGDAIVVVVATPANRRVFVRTIDAGDASATAEAAAQAARSAIRAISLGGTIGIEMPPETVPEPPPPPPAPAPRIRWVGGLGWQVAIDGGADAGAHAIWQRLGVVRGPWGASLAASLGPPLRKDGEVGVELARTSALAVVERRVGSFRFGVGAGAVVYHRATVDTPPDLQPTEGRAQIAFTAAPEVRWVLRPGGGVWAIEVAAGLDVVVGAPELAVERDGAVEILAEIATLQPRLGVGVVVGP